MQDLVASTVAKAHAAHAAASQDPAGSLRTFLQEAALTTVRDLNGAGTLRLLPAMHGIVNAVRPRLVNPKAALYGLWMEWRTSCQAVWPLSMGDGLQVTREGSATALRSSTPALLHDLRTGGVSPLNATLHQLHPPEEDLEVGKVTTFVEGAGEAAPRPRPTNQVYDGTRPPPRTLSGATLSLGNPPGAPASRKPPTCRAAGPNSSRFPQWDQGRPPQGADPLAGAPGHPPALLRRRQPRGRRAEPRGQLDSPLRAAARSCTRAPLSPPGGRGLGRGT